MSRGFGATFGVGTSDVVKPAYTAAPNANKLLSWAAWYYKNSTGGGALAKLLLQNASGSENGITCNSSNTGMKLLIGGANQVLWTDKGLGVWQHICVTLDGSSNLNNGIPYVNGVQVGITGPTNPALGASTGTTYIGNNSLNTTRTWDGMVAHAAYWNGIILSPAEALALASGVPPLLVHPEWLGYYLPLDGVSNPEFDFINGYAAATTGGALGTSGPSMMELPRVRQYFDYGASPPLSSFTDSLALTQGASTFALAASSFSNAIALTQGSSTFALTVAETFVATTALTPANSTFSLTAGAAASPIAAGLSAAPISFAPVSGTGFSGFSVSIAITQGASSIFLTDAEIVGSIVAIQEPNSTFSLTAAFFAGSLTLTQAASSITLNGYNGIAPWAPAIADNSRRRLEEPTLQKLREDMPLLGQTRQAAVPLKKLRQRPPILGD